MIKTLIRCFLGETEAWVSLYDALDVFETFSGVQQQNRMTLMKLIYFINSCNIREDIDEQAINKQSLIEMLPFNKRENFVNLMFSCVSHNQFTQLKQQLRCFIFRDREGLRNMLD